MHISMAIMPAASLRLLLFSLCGDAMGRSASAMKVRGASQPAFQKVRMKIRGAAQPAAKAKAKVKQCSKPRCRNNAASLRVKFCIVCFKDNARCTGARSTGAKGVIGNSGNSSAKGVIGNSGGGNSSAKGVLNRCTGEETASDNYGLPPHDDRQSRMDSIEAAPSSRRRITPGMASMEHRAALQDRYAIRAARERRERGSQPARTERSRSDHRSENPARRDAKQSVQSAASLESRSCSAYFIASSHDELKVQVTHGSTPTVNFAAYLRSGKI